MIEKVYRLIEQEKLIEQGDFVLAGVSGGADSVCLLLLLLAYRDRCAFSLEVIHVEHGIRGEASRADAAFVEALCLAHGIPCHVYAVDAIDYAKQNGIGLEEAARKLRYDCYGRAVCESGGQSVKVALAHHADDNAETILFQLVRGSGIRGMCGMRPIRAMDGGAAVIRPLLAVTRSEIEQYLKEQGQEYRVDVTNLDTDYSRNRIRHKVLPELLKINPGAVEHMTRTSGMLLELSDYLSREAEQLMAKTCHFLEDACEIEESFFIEYQPVLQKEAVLRILSRIAGNNRDIASIHVEEVLRLAERQVGRMLSLPYRMRATRIYGGVRIEKESQAQGNTTGKVKQYDITREMLQAAEAGEEIRILLEEEEICLCVHDFNGEMQEIPKKTYTKWLNYDKIECGLQLRQRADKDYLMIDEKGHKKKLKEYFIEEKIPREQRNRIWLLTEESHVLWVIGRRISADYKIDKNTRKILEVRISGGNYREDQED